MKKKAILVGMMLSVMLLISACGGKEAPINASTQEIAEESNRKAEPENLDNTNTMAVANKESEPMIPEEAVTDGIPIDKEEINIFADRVKKAVADKDMKELADLLSYPTYIGNDEDTGVIIDSEEAFLALDLSSIFTKELVNAIADVDSSSLELYKVGVVMGDDGVNITFNVLEGSSFGITGINN